MIKVKNGWEDKRGRIRTQAEVDNLVYLQEAIYQKRFGYNQTMEDGSVWPCGDARQTYNPKNKGI